MRKIIAALAGTAVLFFGGYAWATPVLTGTPTDPTGITGLTVDGVTYDVAFSLTPADSPFSYGTQASIDAALAVAAALNSAGVTGLDGEEASLAVEMIVTVDPTAEAPELSDFADANGFATPEIPFWRTEAGFVPPPGIDACGCQVVEAAVYTTADVPEPSTPVLFGLGLAGLGYALRKRKSTGATA